MLNKHTIKTAANAREKREPQSVAVNISPFAARWRCFRTHTHTLTEEKCEGGRRTQKLIQWCSQELFTYATRAKLLRTPKKTRLTLFRATLANIWPAPLWAILNRWFGRRRRRCQEREWWGELKRGASVASWKVAGAWWAAWLPAWVVIWRERERERRERREQTSPTSAKMELLFLSVCARLGVCVRVWCVCCHVWAKQAIMIMLKFVRLQPQRVYDK